VQSPFTLGEIFHLGAPGIDPQSAVAPNCSRAARLYGIFISERSTWAKDMQDASLAYHEGDFWGALFRYLLVAEEGSRVAAENAAWMISRGKGYSGANRKELALSLYMRAVEANSTAAMVEAALLHLGGAVPEASREVAWTLLERAAEKGDVEAVFHLAYVLGTRSPSNVTAARAELEKARGLCRRGECFAISAASVLLEAMWFTTKVAAAMGVDASWQAVQELFSGPGLARFMEAQGSLTDTMSEGALAWDSLLLVLLSLALGVTFWLLGRVRQRNLEALAPAEGGEQYEAEAEVLGGPQGPQGAGLRHRQMRPRVENLYG
jgi:hypothetical protein